MPLRATESEVIARVRGILHATLEGVSHSAEATSRGFGLAPYLLRLRKRLAGAQLLLNENQDAEVDERILREVELLFLRRRGQFSGNRANLIRAWNDVLADATEKVIRDLRDAAAYRADAEQMDDGDRAFYAATRKFADRA